MPEPDSVNNAIFSKAQEHLGVLGCAEAGMIMLPDKYNKERQRGLIRVNHTHVDKLKSALMLIDRIQDKRAIARSVGVSGILKKAIQLYIV